MSAANPRNPSERRFWQLWRDFLNHRHQAWTPYDQRVGQDRIYGPASPHWHITQARAALSALRREGYYDR